MHRAESIMQAVLVNITGLTTTEDRVSRGREYPVEASGTPALTLEMGPDLVIEDIDNVGFVDRLLQIRIIAHVKTNSQFDTVLNTIREEVYIAMMATRGQGLNYVQDTAPIGDDDPELDTAEKNVGQQAMNFTIQYRHPLTDPGV